MSPSRSLSAAKRSAFRAAVSRVSESLASLDRSTFPRTSIAPLKSLWRSLTCQRLLEKPENRPCEVLELPDDVFACPGREVGIPDVHQVGDELAGHLRALQEDLHLLFDAGRGLVYGAGVGEALDHLEQFSLLALEDGHRRPLLPDDQLLADPQVSSGKRV
jgi:hypothetical protein